MRRTLRVSLLVLTFVASAHAGEMQGGTPAPPASQPVQVTSQGDIPTADGEMQGGRSESMTEVVMNLLEGVLALF